MWRLTLDIRYASEADPMPFFNEFIQGLASRPPPCATHIYFPPLAGYSDVACLTLNEVNALPDLIALRILRFIARNTFLDICEARHAHLFSNVVYFVGRAVSGEDSITSFTSRTGFCAIRTSPYTCHATHAAATKGINAFALTHVTGQYLQRLQWLKTNEKAIIGSASAAFGV